MDIMDDIINQLTVDHIFTPSMYNKEALRHEKLESLESVQRDPASYSLRQGQLEQDVGASFFLAPSTQNSAIAAMMTFFARVFRFQTNICVFVW